MWNLRSTCNFTPIFQNQTTFRRISSACPDGITDARIRYSYDHNVDTHTDTKTYQILYKILSLSTPKYPLCQRSHVVFPSYFVSVAFRRPAGACVETVRCDTLYIAYMYVLHTANICFACARRRRSSTSLYQHYCDRACLCVRLLVRDAVNGSHYLMGRVRDVAATWAPRERSAPSVRLCVFVCEVCWKCTTNARKPNAREKKLRVTYSNTSYEQCIRRIRIERMCVFTYPVNVTITLVVILNCTHLLWTVGLDDRIHSDGIQQNNEIRELINCKLG